MWILLCRVKVGYQKVTSTSKIVFKQSPSLLGWCIYCHNNAKFTWKRNGNIIYPQEKYCEHFVALPVWILRQLKVPHFCLHGQLKKGWSIGLYLTRTRNEYISDKLSVPNIWFKHGWCEGLYNNEACVWGQIEVCFNMLWLPAPPKKSHKYRQFKWIV